MCIIIISFSRKTNIQKNKTAGGFMSKLAYEYAPAANTSFLRIDKLLKKL